MTISVAVAGASGYAGGELLRLLSQHPQFETCAITAAANAGQALADVHPQLAGIGEHVIEPTTADVLSKADLVFLALPHGASAPIVAELPERVKIVDLGADFRLKSALAWDRYYPGSAHAGTWTYGLPELVSRAELAASQRIANPGCYATAIALGFAPLMALLDEPELTVVAASGTSGAGRKPTDALLASEVMGSISAYKVGGAHQHTPEIEQTLGVLSGRPVRLSFTPLLAPMSRGIHATLIARATKRDTYDVNAVLREFYQGERFVRVLADGKQPSTSSVFGSNAVVMQGTYDPHAGCLVITVVLDNLIKGAAGQALQNANIMCGLEESLGLSMIGVAP